MSHSTIEILPAVLAALRDRLATYCGVYLDDTRVAVLQAAVQRRAQLLGQTSERYAGALAASPTEGGEEWQALAELLLNHETQFFRNRLHMQALIDHVLPELHRGLPAGLPLQLWSAGCATGEEPYSLAIAALEALGDPLPRPVQILATDLSAAALTKARAGVYRGRSLANLSAAQRGRYFTPSDGGLRVIEPLRRLVCFEQRNLLDTFPAAARNVHLVFCQNVTIYFQLHTCRQLMERFYRSMAEGGALFLGFSETLWNIFDRFRWREVNGAYVYYKESRTPQPVPSPLPATRPVTRSASPRPSWPRPVVQPLFAGDELVAEGRALIAAGRAEAALELLGGAPLVGANAPQILALVARAHADRGDLELAAAEARRALELNPLTVEAHLLIGLIYARQGQPAAAIRQLEQARYLDGEAPVLCFHLAECYRQAGRSASALREYRNTLRKLVERPPDELIDGVAVSWLSETCQQYLALLGGEAA